MDGFFYTSNKAVNNLYIYVGNWRIYSAFWVVYNGS
jgi:hypothetical protein